MARTPWIRFAGPLGFALAALLLDLRLLVAPPAARVPFTQLAWAMYGLVQVSIVWGFVLETVDMKARHRREWAAMQARHARERAALARWRKAVSGEEQGGEP